jgi:hypothetical protein
MAPQLVSNLQNLDGSVSKDADCTGQCVYCSLSCPAVRGSNPFGGEIFRNRPDRPRGPRSLLYNGYRVFPGGKAAGAWRLPPTLAGAEVKGVELYLYSPSGPSWSIVG